MKSWQVVILCIRDNFRGRSRKQLCRDINHSVLRMVTVLRGLIKQNKKKVLIDREYCEERLQSESISTSITSVPNKKKNTFRQKRRRVGVGCP